MQHVTDFSVYRVQNPGGVHKWWHRTFQAEWEGCSFAPRGWTEAQVKRRSRRWQSRSVPGRIDYRLQRAWWIAYSIAKRRN